MTAGAGSSVAPQEHTTRTVVVALVVNLGVAMAKGLAAVLSGSAAMFAETAHSVADTVNELLLFVGVRRSTRPQDDSHPLGYGKERYFWAFVAGCGIFLVGGVLAVAEGIETLLDPTPLDAWVLSVVVLLVSMALEGTSWITAYRQLRDEARRRNRSVRAHVRLSSDPASVTVFLEDSAALIGLVLALVAILLHELTGSAVPDGIASVLIGLLLGAVAYALIRRNRGLLLDEMVPTDVLTDLGRVVTGQAWIGEVVDLDAVWVGPRQMLVMVEVVPAAEVPLESVLTSVEDLRTELLGSPFVSRAFVTLRSAARP